MARVIFLLLLLTAPLTSLTAQPVMVVTVLKGFDPVELTAGRELPGDPAIAVTRGKYRYHFVSDANRIIFEREPERYQIQLGGGCGRMGSLSGAGDPDRFLVHAQRIYIFASEQCRNSFKAAPESHLEAPDPVPTGTPAQRQRGAELVRLALRGLGGEAAVDRLAGYTVQSLLGYSANGKVSEYPQTQTFSFPGRYRNEYDWGGSLEATELVPGRVTTISARETWVREEPVRAAMERELYRHPLAILKVRRSAEFVALAGGPGRVGDRPVEYLRVACHGATTRLAIDLANGRIVEIAYRDRRGAFGDLVRTFTDFRPVAGLVFPFVVSEHFNGRPVTSPVMRITAIELR